MKKKIEISFVVLLITISNFGWASNNPPTLWQSIKITNTADPKCLECLNKLLNSYEGEYDAGNEAISYRMFAIKYKKEWFMLTLDNLNNLSSYRAFPEADSVQMLSNNLTADLCKFLQKKLYVKNERKYNECLAVGDIPIKRYYELNREGRNAFKSIYMLEFGKQPNTFFKTLAKPFKAIAKLFKKPKVPDAKKATESIPVTKAK